MRVRGFPFGDEGRYKFTIRADFFNALNIAHYANPNGTLGNQNFGRITDILAQAGGLQAMARELGISEADAAKTVGAELMAGGFVASPTLRFESRAGVAAQRSRLGDVLQIDGRDPLAA